MNIKNLIEAVKFQVSVKPQDDFMREVAEGLEKLYSDNMKLRSDYDAACDELKKWQKLQPIGCPMCHRGCFSNDKFCPHCVLSSNGAILTESLEEYDKLIADISAEAVKEFAERLKEKFNHLEYVINSSRKTIPIQTVKAEVDAILQNGCLNVIDSVKKEMEVD